MSDKLQEAIISDMLHALGEDPGRAGLIETPKRVAKMWDELYAGYKQNPDAVMKIFPAEDCDEIVLVKDITFHSMCEHHIMPFFGVAHVAYIPNPKIGIVGISKLARLVEIFSRRLQIQERLGMQVVEVIEKHLKPVGSACVLTGTHTCMTARGINKPGSMTTTSALRGVFKKDSAARAELMAMINV